MPIYDTIGLGYAERRLPDPRIASQIKGALEGAETVLNVGAGAGSYEPDSRRNLAVEPSRLMIRQRGPAKAPAIQADAEALPLADKSFDAAMALLTLHHWSDQRRGLAELARVARRRIVIFTWSSRDCNFWLTADYIPEIREVDDVLFPSLEFYEEGLGTTVRVVNVPIPHDCTDGFLCAYWRRPEAYLDRSVRAAISTFSKIPDQSAALELLRRDIRSGEWNACHADLLKLDELDLGYRLLIADLV